MKQSITVACIQTGLRWEDAAANRQHFAAQIKMISKSVDLIVLPEMFTTGFSMNPAPLAETMSGDTLAWMTSIAKQSNAVVAGSVIIKENDKYLNRFLWVDSSGAIQYYDKRHLFSLAGEHEHYTAGDEIVVIDYHGWKISLNICYDLRFPVWSRNTDDHHLALYVANWPRPRSHAWKTLLCARAIENQCYVVGVNRIGKDANENEYIGQSAIIDMEGNYLANAESEDGIFYAELDKNKLISFREQLPFYRDRDEFNIIN